MTEPFPFRAWRESEGLTREQAADKLGMSAEGLRLYEDGESRGPNRHHIETPRRVRLACLAISLGFEDWSGQAESVISRGGKPRFRVLNTEGGPRLRRTADGKPL